MATVTRFEDLLIWQKSRTLCSSLINFLNSSGFKTYDPFYNQIVRAAISIPTNIAEGFERDGRVEFRQFVSIAKASNGEVRSLLYILSDTGKIDEITFNSFKNKTDELGKMLGSMIKYLNSSDKPGLKFKEPEELYSASQRIQ
jgi:four helix bundle protein